MSDTLSLNPQIDYMEQGKKPPHYTPDSMRNVNPITSSSTLEEGKGFYYMNRPSSPFPYSSSTLTNENQNQNPSVWEKVKRTFGLGGKRRLRKMKTLKIKKMGKSRKSRKFGKKSRRKSFKKLYKKRGGTTRKVWIAEGKTPNGYYGGSAVVNPYSPPMDFAPVKDIPTAQPHHWVG
jgi:hypothetical protein